MEQQANRIASYFPEYKAAQKSRTTFDSSLQPLISLCSKSIILFEFRSVNSFQVNPWWQTCMFQVTKVVIFFFSLPRPMGWVLSCESTEDEEIPWKGMELLKMDCLPFSIHIFWQWKILKTGRNEKRDEGTSRIVKENMQINILRICKQILTEWLLKNWADHQCQSSWPNSRCSKMDGQMIKWHLNCNSLGSTEGAWPLVQVMPLFFLTLFMWFHGVTSKAFRENSSPAFFGCRWNPVFFLEGRVDQLRMLQTLLVASTCWVSSLGCESYFSPRRFSDEGFFVSRCLMSFCWISFFLAWLLSPSWVPWSLRGFFEESQVSKAASHHPSVGFLFPKISGCFKRLVASSMMPFLSNRKT